jgi:ubiquinone/menaquinone biosynthesis C-methylase UbiE
VGDRPDQPHSIIEFASTLVLIDRYFPATGHVCDIGGGPGRFSVALLERGYQVTLFDLSAESLRLAHEQFRLRGLHPRAVIQGDARDMQSLPGEEFDAALLMGPMYHLVDQERRASALQHLVRVLKPGAVAIIAYLNSWGLIRTGVADFAPRYRDPAFLRAMQHELVFRGTELTGFTECYWTTPPVALGEIGGAGLELVSYASAEGFAGGLHPLLDQLAGRDPVAYRNVVEAAAEACELPQYRDTGNHLHLVVRKASGS